MRLCRHIPTRTLEVWHPRYHDRRVLLAAHRIGQHNKVVFTKVPNLEGKAFYIDGPTARRFKKESNGTIDCYAVPMDELQGLEINAHCEHEA